MYSKNPSEIARETLKLLAQRRLWPTPENYQALYLEVAGLPSSGAHFPEDQLQNIVRVLPAQTPVQKHLLEQLRAAVADKDWAALQTVWVAYANLGLTDVPQPLPPPSRQPPCQCVPQALAQQIALFVEHLRPALGDDDPSTLELAQRVLQHFRREQPELDTAQALLQDFSQRLSFVLQDQADIRLGLLRLLALGLDNIAILNLDDTWLQGQIQALRAVAAPPLSLRRLEELEQRLGDVIYKQSEAKHRLLQAQADMKALLAAFIDRLAQMDDSSTHYQGQLEACATRLNEVTQLHELTPLLHDVMSATRQMTESSRQARSELQDLRQRSDASNAEITQLRQELERTSALARHDGLTGTLNRQGLDEAMHRASERAALLGVPLCLAILDLDNFKSLNDRLGHATGDRALQHLVEITRQVMRGQDQLARYGGEEFVVILPNTTLEQAVDVMKRLQRELTKRYFLQGNERILITFSAGVTQLQPSESHEQALSRADRAMYQAKRAGKNRVMAA